MWNNDEATYAFDNGWTLVYRKLGDHVTISNPQNVVTKEMDEITFDELDKIIEQVSMIKN